MLDDLLRRFDLDHPDLAAVNAAAQRGGLERAGDLLLEHYAARRRERCLAFWDMSGPEDYPPMPWDGASTPEQLWKNTPERVAEGRLYASGHEFDFSRDEDIDWSSDVRKWADGARYPFAQARNMLRRMYFLRPLDLFYLRGNAEAQDRAARQFVRLVESWWRQWEEDEFVVNGALRLGDPVAQSGLLRSWFVFLPSPLLSREFKLRLLRHMIDLAEDIERRAVWHPWVWGLSEAAGIGYAGLLFPELKAAAAWRERCFAFYDTFMKTEIRADGTLQRMHFCPHYTGGTAAVSISFLRQVGRLGHADVLSPEAHRAFLRLVDWVADVQKPDNTVPQITASDEQGFARWLDRAGKSFDRPDWRYIARAGRAGRRPDHTSRILPQAGAFILRDGFRRDAMYACFHNGDYHNIERTDLAVDLYAFGRTLVTAPGRYGYYTPEWKPYYATAGYNTLMVDGSPHQEWGVHSLERRDDLGDTAWRLGRDFDWAWGSHPTGFDAAGEVHWQRGVLFAKGGYWLVVDRVSGPGEHDFSLRWLLTPSRTEVEPDGRSLHTRNADANVRLTAALPAGARMQLWEGSREPLRGWYSPENGRTLPAPQVEYTWRGTLPALAATLIVPYRRRVPSHALEIEEPTGGLFRVSVRDRGGEDTLVLDLRGAGSAGLERRRGGGARRVSLTPADGD